MAKVPREEYERRMRETFGEDWETVQADQAQGENAPTGDQDDGDEGTEAGQRVNDARAAAADLHRRQPQGDPRQLAKAHMEELSAAANVTPGDPLPVYAWVARGIVGGINVLDGLNRQDSQIAEYWCHFLDQAADRLKGLVKQAKERQGF